jgi:hypothetical protein
MNSLLPDRFLRLMSASDRAAIKQRTAEETAMRAEAKDERTLQEQICCLLRRGEIPYIRPAMFKKSTLPQGWPDFTFAYHGFPIAWECKIGRNKQTKEQADLQKLLEWNGWQYAVVKSLLQAQAILFNFDEKSRLTLSCND